MTSDSNSNFVSTKSCCPYCGYGPLDGASGVGHTESPEKDDLTICLKCMAVCRFDEDENSIGLVIKKVTIDEFEQLPQEKIDELNKVISFIKFIQAEKAKKNE